MAGKRRRKLRSTLSRLTAKVNYDGRSENKNKRAIEENQTWSDLPSELLELIISRLVLEDNIRASAVCKRWHEVATSVRVVDQPPWLIYFPKCGNLYEFYDPSKCKTYTHELPELVGSEVRYSRDGWLLLSRAFSTYFFFFNPFTQELINLPGCSSKAYGPIAFSCAPTSNSCLLFAIMHIRGFHIAIGTCHPGATKWTIENFQIQSPFLSIGCCKQVLFSNGLFYCLSYNGCLAAFDPSARTWNVLPVTCPQCPDLHFFKPWTNRKYIVEHKGDIFLIYACHSKNPVVFKLDRKCWIWEMTRTLGGLTVFASSLSSKCRSYLPGMMRNSVYFPKIRFFGRRCMSYSVDEARYYPSKQCCDWEEPYPYVNIWIEPPKNISDFI